MNDVNESKWRCRSCGLLLGICRGARVEIRYKDCRWIAYGEVCAICRRCGDTNTYGAAPRASIH